MVIKGKTVTAHENDMVVWQNKEYLYRKDESDVLGWFEVGNEESYNWFIEEDE